MRIRDIQSEKIIKDILQEELRSGIIPTEETISYLFQKRIKGKKLGMPFLNFEEIKPRERSDSEKYNRMLDEIADDLDTIFTALNEQGKQIINDFSLQENEKIKILAQIQAMENEMDELETIASDNKTPYSISENFSSFENIDLNESTAFFSLPEKYASLNLSYRDLLKVPLNNADIKIISVTPDEFAAQKELSSLSKCIDDYINTFWSHQIQYRKDRKPEEVSIELLLTLPDEYMVSQVTLTPRAGGNTYVRMYYLYNNTWQEFSSNSGSLLNKKESWFVYPEPVLTKQIKIILTKKEPDIEEEHPTYIFGLKNISVDYREYVNQSVVKTKELKLKSNNGIDNHTIQGISIKAEDEIPSETDIDYFIQVKENNNFFKDPDFNDKKMWNAKYYYNIGGVDGGSYCGSNETWGFYQGVNLIKNRVYTLSGYVRMPEGKGTVRVYAKSLGNIYIEADKNWTYFEYTATATQSGENRIYILDSEKSGREVQADKFSLVEGEIAEAEVFSEPIPISPANRENPKYEQYISFNNIGEKKETFSSKDLVKYSTKYTKDYYKIALKEKPIPWQSKLYQGVKRWKVNSFHHSLPKGESVGLYLWNATKRKDWNKTWWLHFVPSEVINEYQEKITLKNSNNMLYKFTTWIYCDKPQTYNKTGINYNKCYDMETLYVNNSKVKKHIEGSTYSYNIQFSIGWNKIEWVVYLKDGEDASLFNNFIDLSSFENWRAEKNPMKEVSLHDLYTNYPYTDDSIYAIDNEGNIILNNIQTDSSGNITSNNNYSVSYKYCTNIVDTIKIIAELKTNNPYVTPKIKKIKINTHY